MTKFTDTLFDDLMREHGAALTTAPVSSADKKRRLAVRPVLLTAGAGGLAFAATAGILAAGGGSPAYAVTTHSDGTVTLAVYQKSGIAQANAKLRQLGDDRVVVVPVESGCPSISSLPAPAVPTAHVSVSGSVSSTGSVTVDASGIPAGDILVMGFQTSAEGKTTVTEAAQKLTTGPAPSCVSIPRPPAGDFPSSPGSPAAGTSGSASG